MDRRARPLRRRRMSRSENLRFVRLGGVGDVIETFACVDDVMPLVRERMVDGRDMELFHRG